MRALPSQHPPDWWNMRGPCWAQSRASRSLAAGASSTRGEASPAVRLVAVAAPDARAEPIAIRAAAAPSRRLRGCPGEARPVPLVLSPTDDRIQHARGQRQEVLLPLLALRIREGGENEPELDEHPVPRHRRPPRLAESVPCLLAHRVLGDGQDRGLLVREMETERRQDRVEGGPH